MPTPQKTMLPTGASRGIGHATVKLFYEHGWRVLTVSRHPFDPGCPWPGGPDNHIQADLADAAAYPRLVADVRTRINGSELHALVNNAGVSPKGFGGSRLGVLDSDYRTWLSVLSVNLISTAILARGLFPELKAARGTIESHRRDLAHAPRWRADRLFLVLLFFFELQRGGINAETQAGGIWAVVKDVPEMRIAAAADGFGAHHAVADVAFQFHVIGRDRLVIAGPP